MRSGHGADDQQGNEGMGARSRFLDAVQLTKDVPTLPMLRAARLFSTS